MDDVKRFWSKVQKTDDCWLWQGVPSGNNGYGRFYFDYRSVAAHRYAWEQVHGFIPDGMKVLHKCDVPLCCRPEHLFLGTQGDNMRDMAAKGRGGTACGDRNGKSTKPEQTPRGSRHGAAKLTEEDVRLIRQSFSGIRGQKAGFARQYGVDKSLIKKILDRKVWTHV